MAFRFSQAIALLLSFPYSLSGLELNVQDPTSIRNAAATIAHGLLDYYHNNASDTPAGNVGLLPYPPYYWWESGAMWAGMVDYYSYTKDSSYVQSTIQAYMAQVGPNHDFIVPAHKFDEGNDDQAFWGLGLMSALENQFPSPPSSQPQWLTLAQSLFDNQVLRWDNTSCNGGLKWQIYPENSYGYDYKNAVSNGAFFQMAARLARYTGNQKYEDWASRTWDWCSRIGLISPNYDVFDGTNDKLGCTDVDHDQWTYNIALFLEGSAALWNLTGSDTWKQRTTGLLEASKVFFSPFPNATNIMFEAACEPYHSCNTDQFSFKAYLARWLAKTAVLAPFTASTIQLLLETSAKAAATSCSGGSDGVTCGTKWYVDGWDGTWGAGQQLSALEVIQALLITNAGPPYSPALQPSPAVQPRNTSNHTTTGGLHPATSGVPISNGASSSVGGFLTTVVYAAVLIATAAFWKVDRR